MLVGCDASRHIPATWYGVRKSTKPAGIPRTTSQLKPSTGRRSASGRSGDSSKRISRPSARVSSSATDSAILTHASISARGIVSCERRADIWRELRRKHEHASCWTSVTFVFGAWRNSAHWLIFAKWQSAANSSPCFSAHSSSSESRSLKALPHMLVHMCDVVTNCAIRRDKLVTIHISRENVITPTLLKHTTLM